MKTFILKIQNDGVMRSSSNVKIKTMLPNQKIKMKNVAILIIYPSNIDFLFI
jgi:hypothetical protein